MSPAFGESGSSTDRVHGEQVMEIPWHCNPFRADRFGEIWRPVVEASMEYGARWYSFYRAQGDVWQYKQLMAFDEKIDFERYWYSEEISEARARAAGLYQVPVMLHWQYVIAQGERSGTTVTR